MACKSEQSLNLLAKLFLLLRCDKDFLQIHYKLCIEATSLTGVCLEFYLFKLTDEKMYFLRILE